MELNKAVLDCMQQLRRRLRAEQGIDIHLNQSDVLSALLGACAQSDSLQTRQLGAQLQQLCGEAPAQAGDDGETQRRAQPLYRGQIPEDSAAATPPADAEQRPVRIYRGQRIYG